MQPFLLLRIVYIANIIVAGWISLTSMFAPKTAASSIFSGAYENTDVIRLVGCLWFAIAILSVFGLIKPLQFSPVLLVQLIYKATWLVVVMLPAISNGKPYPGGMAAFFVVWVALLPFAIPWASLFR